MNEFKTVKLSDLWNEKNKRYEITEPVRIEETEINGNLDVCSNATLPNLQTVGGNLYVHSNATLQADNLQTVGGYLDVYSNATLQAPNAKKNQDIPQEIKNTIQAAKDLHMAPQIKKNIKTVVADGYCFIYRGSRKIGNGEYFKNQLNPKMNVYIEGNLSAHGASLKECLDALTQKKLKLLDFDKKKAEFVKQFPRLDLEYPAKDLYEWHHVLTGSCKAGRDNFMASNGFDINGKYTLNTFFNTTVSAYGGEKIKQIRDMYMPGKDGDTE